MSYKFDIEKILSDDAGRKIGCYDMCHKSIFSHITKHFSALIQIYNVLHCRVVSKVFDTSLRSVNNLLNIKKLFMAFIDRIKLEN